MASKNSWVHILKLQEECWWGNDLTETDRKKRRMRKMLNWDGGYSGYSVRILEHHHLFFSPSQ